MTLLLHPNFPRPAGASNARPLARWQTLLSTALSNSLHIFLLSLAFALAFAVRYDFSLTAANARPWFTAYFLPLLPLLLAIKLTISFSMGLHRGTWRYVGLGDLRRLLLGSLASLLLLTSAYYLWDHLSKPGQSPIAGVPNTIFLLDSLFALLLLGGARILSRLLHEESRPIANGGLVRLLIIGAGDAAESALREIARMPEQRYRVVGLLDDDARKTKTRIHGSPILGPISSLPRICTEKQVAEILIALPNASNTEMQRIISMCRATQMAADMRGDSLSNNASGGGALRFRTLPSLQDIVAGKAFANQIRDVSVNDLLGRDAVQTDLTSVGALLHQQPVLVSGAGGSIGSELCRTICRFAPSSLILLDKAENAIFEIERELKKEFPTVPLIAAIGDISDAIRMEQVFADYAPAVVFHAAAHKHVPLAESNPGEAIRNNVFGTKTLADAAIAANVKNFVMISTDKAVNPSSIMGATKRCAEIYIQSLAHRNKKLSTQHSALSTNFITVRFGNVLGSNGSVVPIFKQQIAAGGPVTVTHPEMRRYFMTIPEASQLVLQAGALGQRGEIFVLDMGQPVRILDLARDVIILSGLRPEVDIPIVFTGLRPGEKLYEELSIRGENMLQTRHPKIAIWRSQPANNTYVQKMIDELEPLQHCTDRQTVLFALKQFVPEMSPWQAESQPQKLPAPKNPTL